MLNWILIAVNLGREKCIRQEEQSSFKREGILGDRDMGLTIL